MSIMYHVIATRVIAAHVVAAHAVAASAVAVPADGDWWDALNPFAALAGEAGKVVADGWTAAMLGLWSAGLWLLRVVLSLTDAFLVPDLSESGPGAGVYRTTAWIGVTLLVILAMVQVGVATVRRDGSSLARLAIGVGQFVLVWAAWVGYAAAVVAACGGLTQALIEQLLGVDAWSAWQPWAAFSTQDITDGTVATVLGLMGLVLVFAAIGHLLVMLTRAGALIVLATTAPISAAGLAGEVGSGWFWRSFRWFHAAAFTPVVLVLTLGIGVQMTTGVATGMTDDLQQAVGTALPGVVLILISCFSPLALFKLLAFVDPGTSSGAGLRRGLAAHGGVQGLLGGRGGSSATNDAASSTDEYGRSDAETSAQADTSARATQGASGLLGVAGAGAAAAVQAAARVGSAGAAIGSDLTNQMGVGHQSYHPDLSPSPRRTTGSSSSSGTVDSTAPGGGDDGGGDPGVADPSGATGIDTAAAGIVEHTPSPPPPPRGGSGPGGGAGSPASSGSGSASGAGSAGGVDAAAGDAALGAAAL